jgi:hypothetical protein
MKYLFLIVPFLFFFVSNFYRDKSKKLKYTGRVPDIVAAEGNKTLFLILSVISLLIAIRLIVKY